MLSMYEIIRKKRDGQRLSDEEIRFFIQGYVKNEIPDYQMAALLMAMFLRGLDADESNSYTEAMLHSGRVIDLSDISGIKVDKHSTGGVGDKVSIILAPIVAAAGVPVPMISGRGLGHTGGTLDKLESIPNFRVNMTVPEFKERLQKVGACLIGQTDEIVPADKKIYALRDVTATVESIPLICGSIMSKKIAEGIDALVLDIKTGSGAFMKEYDQSKELARQLIQIGERFGKKTIAYITNMNQPLGRAVGNWLEIKECLEAMQGKGPQDLLEVTLTLSGAMIYLGGKVETIEDGIGLAKQILDSGAAMEKFLEIVVSHNGDPHFLFHPDQYPKSRFEVQVKAEQDGYLAKVDAFQVGLTAVILGAGRRKAEDDIDPKAGIMVHKKAPQKVSKGDVIMTFYTDKESVLQEAQERLQQAVSYSQSEPQAEKMILEYLDKDVLAQ